MTDFLLNKKCKPHDLEIIAINIYQTTSIDQMILCRKCLIEKRFSTNKAILIEEIPEYIKSMKNTINIQKLKALDIRYSYFVELKDSIVQYQQFIENIMKKILEQIEYFNNSLQQQRSKHTNEQANEFNEQDLLYLTKYLMKENLIQNEPENDDSYFIKYIVEQMEKTKQCEKLQKIIQLLNNKLQQTNTLNKMKFSKVLKHAKIEVSEDCKTVASLEKVDQICLCDQPISNDKVTSIEFRIKKLQYLYAGICIKDKINDNYEIKVYATANQNNNWCWLMFYNGSAFLHQQDEQKHNFRFNKNDNVRIEVDQINKRITWINKTQNYPSVSAFIPISGGLYFCFNLYGQNKIELL